MGRNKVIEGSEEVCLGLVGREGSNRVISVENDIVIITVHNDRRDFAML